MIGNNVDWNERYRTGDTRWNIGEPSRPLKEYFNQLEDKTLKILIPGCGYGHEIVYLYQELGFQNVHVIDLSAIALEDLKNRIPDIDARQIIAGDFFSHSGNYDLIIEQTFFCAIRPWQRWEYVNKMYELLNRGGKLCGLMFHGAQEKEGPPFYGEIEEYKRYFSSGWNIRTMEKCHNSIDSRAGRELFINIQKDS